mmetsp:Transcript_16387/g.23388  ORF Transcript_16387/g.23388 Transcript_16387/m.23388 type:complete len:460 (+) Transcript_16387:231-1610(+)
MGNLLSEPITEKETEEGITISGLAYAASSMQGWRTHMEDAHICESYLTVKVPISNSTESTSFVAVGDDNKTQHKGILAVAESIHEVIVLQDHSIFAVFDGHGGEFAAKYAAKHFVRVLTSLPSFQNYAMLFHESNRTDSASSESEQETLAFKMKLSSFLEQSLRDAFYEVDNELLATCRQPQGSSNSRKRSIALVGNECSQKPNTTVMPVHGQSIQDLVREIVQRSEADEISDDDNPTNGETNCGSSGTTAVVVLVTPTQILCANAGDSRAIFSSTKSQSIPLSYDHKPSDEYELTRIVNAGGYVSNDRINGDLAVARGLGDFRFKTMQNLTPDLQKVTALPDIIALNRNVEEDLFMFIGCDGIWDVCSNENAAQTILGIFNEGESSLGLVCEEMMDLCLNKGSKDNMTAVLVAFPALKTKFEHLAQNTTTVNGVMARRQERARVAEESRKTRQHYRHR